MSTSLLKDKEDKNYVTDLAKLAARSDLHSQERVAFEDDRMVHDTFADVSLYLETALNFACFSNRP